MSIVSVFARFRRGGQAANMKASSVVPRSAAGRALSSLTVVVVAVALAPGLRGHVAHAESQAPPPRLGVMSAGGLNFSDPPRDDEFLRTGLFAQPLVPVGAKATTPGENRELAAALQAYVAGTRGHGPDEVGPLLAFLENHPQSPWRASLEVDVGAIYRRFGHFSKALPSWQTAWDEAKGLRDPNGRAIGDAAAGYLSQMEAYLGRKETLAPLLDEIKKRPVRGSARELVENSAEGLASMIHSPQESFRCGPMALARILQLHPSPDTAKSMEALGRAQSTPKGLSLSAVQKQSVDAGMNYQMAFRSPGAPVIVPAVAHWKVGHFAAILSERSDGHYVVGDLTFGDDVVVSRETLDEEASGFFLVPPGPLPEGWRRVEPAEGDSVWGRGNTGNNHDLAGTGSQETPAFPCPGPGGCTTWNVEASLVSLSLHDDPVGYRPPYGRPIRFNMSYSHRDAMQVTPFGYTNFGNKWTFEWLSYIEVTGCDGDYGQTTIASTAPPAGTLFGNTLPTCVSLYRHGGGAENYFFQDPLDSGNVQSSTIGQFSQAYLTVQYQQSSDGGSDAGEPTSFTRTLPDGTVEYYAFQLGAYDPPYGFPQYFLTGIDDPQGNHVSIAYDSQARITTITDPLGQNTTVCYNDSYQESGSPCAQPSGAAAPDCTNFPACNLMVTQIIDPFGRYASFGYGQGNHLTSITDTIGIESQFHYQLDANGDPTDFVDQLTTPYGITQFSFYGALDTTVGDSPSDSDGDRAVKIVDPLGRTSMVEYIQGDTGALQCSASNVVQGDTWSLTAEPNTHIPCADKNVPSSSGVPESYWEDDKLQYRNTFIWDAYQFAASCPTGGLSTNTAGGLAPNGLCYPNAKIIHWLHTNEDGGIGPNVTNPDTASRIPESIKGPTESRIWFAYPNQSSGVFGYSTIGVGSTNRPIVEGRVITNPVDFTQTSQIWQYQYNANGNVTNITDPAGRTFQLGYAANGIDLINVVNTSNHLYDVLLTIAPNAQHLPLSVTPANGQATTFIYNSAGQILTKTEPSPGGTWTYCYQQNNCGSMTPGYLQSVTGPNGAPQYKFTYDTAGRIGSTTDPSGEYIQYWYDNADRLTQAKFPDATTQQLGYTNLDLTSVLDRAGYTTARTYDADRELTSIQENAPSGRTTVLTYWPNKKLASIQDPNGNTTSIDIDLEGNTDKYYNSQAGQSPTYYEYDDAGRTAQITPTANNGATNYWYNADNTLQMVEVDVQFNGPTFNYQYDPSYKRLKSASKTVGGNTVSSEAYSYFPVTYPASLGANRLEEVTSTVNFPDAPSLSLTSTIDYKTSAGAPGYDALNHMTARQLTGPGMSVGESWVYDALGRLVTDTNALDTFTYSYADATDRVGQITSPHGPSAATAYWTPAQRDGLLRILNYTYGSTELAGYGYSFGPRHNALQFVERVFDTLSTTTTYTNTYWSDPYGQLTQVQDATSTTSQVTDYGYDAAGNLTSWEVTNNPFVQGAPSVNTTYNAANQIVTQQTTYAGEVGTYTVNASYDVAGNLTTLALPPPATSSAFACSYEAMNDPVDCTIQGNHSVFVYDGLERPIRVTHLSSGGTTVSDETYMWCGDSLCAAFDNTSGSPVANKLYVNQGAVVFNPPVTYDYYYVRDLLGSVRAVATNNASAPIVTKYEYDPYGYQTVTSGDGSASDFGFAGMFRDSTTGLEFARNRVYYAAAQRWLSRDPSGYYPAFGNPMFNAANVNLYTYVWNNPSSAIDPSGLSGLTIGWTGGGGAYVGVTGGFGFYIGSDGAGLYATGGRGVVLGAEAGFGWAFGSFGGETPAGQSTVTSLSIEAELGGSGGLTTDKDVAASLEYGVGASWSTFDTNTWAWGVHWPWYSKPKPPPESPFYPVRDVPTSSVEQDTVCRP